MLKVVVMLPGALSDSGIDVIFVRCSGSSQMLWCGVLCGAAAESLYRVDGHHDSNSSSSCGGGKNMVARATLGAVK